MTNQLVYVDQNIISHFCKAENSVFWNSCHENGLRFIVSDIHLTEICISPNPLSFAASAERLGAYYLSHEKETELERVGNVELLPFDAVKQIEQHAQDVGGIERYFLQGMLPMLKLSGGLADINIQAIEDEFIQTLRKGIQALPVDLGPISGSLIRTFFRFRLWFAEREIRNSFQNINFHEDTAKLVSIRNRIHAAGDMSQVPSEMLVEKVFGMFDDADSEQIRKDFPPGFGVDAKNRSSKVMTFAFLLFTVGSVPKSGKAYRGDVKTQKNRYRAQFLDCMHIGKASNFSAFLTNDFGANRLAQAVYSYAGVPARSILIEQKPDIA